MKFIYRIIGLFFLSSIVLFSSCQVSAKPEKTDYEKQCVDLTDGKDDEYLNITTINDVGDTLFRRYNNTKGTVKVMYKGDTVKLVQDISGINYSNGRYVMIKQKGNTVLEKDGNVIFSFP